MRPGEGVGYSIYPWVGRCGTAPHTLTLFKTNIADFPTLIKTKNDKFDTLFKTKIPKNIPWRHTLAGRTSPLSPYKGVPPPPLPGQMRQFYGRLVNRTWWWFGLPLNRNFLWNCYLDYFMLPLLPFMISLKVLQAIFLGGKNKKQQQQQTSSMTSLLLSFD